MNRDIEALCRTHGHVAAVAELAEMIREHLQEGRFEDAEACLRLIEQHALVARNTFGSILDYQK